MSRETTGKRVISKQRVSHRGEVFTNQREVIPIHESVVTLL
jgi:hypothetical protein